MKATKCESPGREAPGLSQKHRGQTERSKRIFAEYSPLFKQILKNLLILAYSRGHLGKPAVSRLFKIFMLEEV